MGRGSTSKKMRQRKSRKKFLKREKRRKDGDLGPSGAENVTSFHDLGAPKPSRSSRYDEYRYRY